MDKSLLEILNMAGYAMWVILAFSVLAIAVAIERLVVQWRFLDRARAMHDVVVAKLCFDSTTRTIIDGRTDGFCKLIADRQTRKILGCHVVGERAVEITQIAAVAIAGDMRVDDLAQVPLSFPTYAGVLGRVAANATRQLNLDIPWASQVEGA